MENTPLQLTFLRHFNMNQLFCW